MSSGSGRGRPAEPLVVLINKESGTVRDMGARACAGLIRRAFRAAGRKAKVHMLAPRGLRTKLGRIAAARSGGPVVIGGGDGTTSLAAAKLAGTKVALGALPLGTFNLFSRALGIPLDIEGAVRCLAVARIARIDVGEIDGRVFVHHIGLGFHPRLVRLRDRFGYSSRLRKLVVGGYAFFRLLRRPTDIHIVARCDGEAQEYRTPVMIISNNPFAPVPGPLPVPDRPDKGVLALYVCKSRGLVGVARAMMTAVLGNWETSSLFEAVPARRIEILGRGKRRLTASIDGETLTLETPFTARIRPRALRALVPPE